MPFIVDFPIEHVDFPVRYVKLPEGIGNGMKSMQEVPYVDRSSSLGGISWGIFSCTKMVFVAHSAAHEWPHKSNLGCVCVLPNMFR